MQERKIYILVALILLLNGESFSQEKIVEKKWNNRAEILKMQSFEAPGFWQANSNFKTFLRNNSSKFLLQPYEVTTMGLFSRFDRIVVNPMEFQQKVYSNTFQAKPTAFFCVQELRFEKATSIPLRLRLGSLAYTDYLEQKPNALKP